MVGWGVEGYFPRGVADILLWGGGILSQGLSRYIIVGGGYFSKYLFPWATLQVTISQVVQMCNYQAIPFEVRLDGADHCCKDELMGGGGGRSLLQG